MHKCRWNVKSLPTLAHVPNTNCGGGRKSKVEQAESEHRKSKQQRERQRKPHTPRSQPCCSQGYAHCPRALHHQPLPPSRLLCRPCACRHQRSTPPALLCAMPRTRPREPPTLQRTARERDWVLRRVEVCEASHMSIYNIHDILFLPSVSTPSNTQSSALHKTRKKEKADTDRGEQNNT